MMLGRFLTNNTLCSRRLLSQPLDSHINIGSRGLLTKSSVSCMSSPNMLTLSRSFINMSSKFNPRSTGILSLSSLSLSSGFRCLSTLGHGKNKQLVKTQKQTFVTNELQTTKEQKKSQDTYIEPRKKFIDHTFNESWVMSSIRFVGEFTMIIIGSVFGFIFFGLVVQATLACIAFVWCKMLK